jgi:hypothetical protein
MGKFTRPSEARLAQIIQRQDPPRFGSTYDPAIRACREEAPQWSRPAWVWWDKVKRELSTLSLVERCVLMLCLHNPRLWEVHDQRMLPMWSRPHPLTGHPRASKLTLPPMRGTMEIARVLGVERCHPVVKIRKEDNANAYEYTAFPWVGDMLLFLEDDFGPYCVNLDIKDVPEAFDVPFDGSRRRSKRAVEKAKARHAIEQQLYADVGIRTVRLTRKDYHEGLISNLTALHLWHKRKSNLNEEQKQEIVDNLRAGLANGEAPIEVAFALTARHGWTQEQIKIVAHTAVWRRELRVDLFRAFLFDHPMRPEACDPLDLYSHWFARG